jgi:hypothetical protein
MKLRDGREIDAAEVVRHNGRFNVYDCEKGHELLSLDLDEGVTPAFTICPFDGTTAGSRFYRVHNPGGFGPLVMVWRKATPGELKRERRTGGDHYARGGLAREWLVETTSPSPVPVVPFVGSRQARRWVATHPHGKRARRG